MLPAIAYLNGEYGGLKDIYLGVCTILGGNGFEKIIDLELTDDEQAALHKSAAGVKELIETLKL